MMLVPFSAKTMFSMAGARWHGILFNMSLFPLGIFCQEEVRAALFMALSKPGLQNQARHASLSYLLPGNAEGQAEEWGLSSHGRSALFEAKPDAAFTASYAIRTSRALLLGSGQGHDVEEAVHSHMHADGQDFIGLQEAFFAIDNCVLNNSPGSKFSKALKMRTESIAGSPIPTATAKAVCIQDFEQFQGDRSSRRLSVEARMQRLQLDSVDRASRLRRSNGQVQLTSCTFLKGADEHFSDYAVQPAPRKPSGGDIQVQNKILY
jgi:hypothetical protein